jgi:hypothetical protein
LRIWKGQGSRLTCPLFFALEASAPPEALEAIFSLAEQGERFPTCRWQLQGLGTEKWLAKVFKIIAPRYGVREDEVQP